MNAHLSELLSWLLEPLANAMMGKSSEVISDEDLKNKIDNLNLANKDVRSVPERQQRGTVVKAQRQERSKVKESTVWESDKISHLTNQPAWRQAGRPSKPARCQQRETSGLKPC